MLYVCMLLTGLKKVIKKGRQKLVMKLIHKHCKLEGNDIRQHYNIQVFKTSKTSVQGSPQI